MHKFRRLSAWNILKREVQSAQKIWRDYFWPHLGNNHHPHIWRRHHVQVLAGLLLVSKVALVIILFSFVPYGAQLSPQVEQAMVNLTNQYRLKLNLPTLTRNLYLDSVAQLRANDMIVSDYFSHYTPDGRKPWEWIDTKQYNFSRLGENLAMDFVTAEAVFKAFVASPTHEKNLRNSGYRDIGVAMVSGALEGKETNLMVILYGAEQPQPAPAVVAKPTEPVTKPQPSVAKPPLPTPVPIAPDRTTPPSELATVSPLTTPTEVKGLEAQVQTPALNRVVIERPGGWLEQLVSYSRDIYFLLLIAFLVIALLNIFVAIRIQRPSAIIASFLLIALAGYLWLANWHVAEGWPSDIIVLGWIF